MLKQYFNRFPHALRGISYALVYDFGYRTQVYLGLLLVSGLLTFFQPLSVEEVRFVALAWVLILITELQNSALEAALNRLHPELHDDIKHSKDMAAGAVFLAGLFLLLVLGTLVWSRFI